MSKISQDLLTDPYSVSFLLEGAYRERGIRKFRIGKYRVLCVITEADKMVHPLDIDLRGDAYKLS